MRTTTTKLILCTSLFFVFFDNIAFFRHVLEVYPLNLKHFVFLASLAAGLTGFIVLLLSLVCTRYTIKPVIIFFLLLSATTAYFMDNYNVVIDEVMVKNIAQTNLGEVSDLLSLKLLSYLLLLGVLPAVIVAGVRLDPPSWNRAIFIKMRDVGLSVLTVLGLVLLFSDFYASFFREHKPLRYYTNPVYTIYSAVKYLDVNFNTAHAMVSPLGLDAHLPANDSRRELVILVVGEAARADRFSLNGYERTTNPLLQKEDVISFANMYSCGTSTSYSVPCMFSPFSREKYSDGKGEANENLLDVLKHAGVHVLWRDNNSDSKGVALRVPYQDFRHRKNNPVCDDECRDEGMLAGLQTYIDDQKDGDILIVLHQMGNHGPAYYKRYPAAFEKFTPVCRSNEFDECTDEEIGNAYDNALLYTDYFLARTIALLKNNSPRFETAMIYLSDHGESLGEYGLYLHGMPYALAPDSQKHVAAVFWFGQGFDIDRQSLLNKSGRHFSQDNLFHTILGLMEVETAVYDRKLDITHH